MKRSGTDLGGCLLSQVHIHISTMSPLKNKPPADTPDTDWSDSAKLSSAKLSHNRLSSQRTFVETPEDVIIARCIHLRSVEEGLLLRHAY